MERPGTPVPNPRAASHFITGTTESWSEILPTAGRCQARRGVTQVVGINAPPRRAMRCEPESLDRGSDLNPDKTAIADKRDSCERREALTDSLGRFGHLGCAVYDLGFAPPWTKPGRLGPPGPCLDHTDPCQRSSHTRTSPVQSPLGSCLPFIFAGAWSSGSDVRAMRVRERVSARAGGVPYSRLIGVSLWSDMTTLGAPARLAPPSSFLRT